jgi:hypothetical protein
MFSQHYCLSYCISLTVLSDYIIEKEPLVNKFISVPTEGGKYILRRIFHQSREEM